MSKVLRIQEGGYKVITEAGKEILLDTGSAGQVRVTGDLIVEGERTELNVRELNVEDKIIIINNMPGSSYEGIGPPEQAAGLEIRRGVAPSVSFLYDEDPTLDYYPPNDPDLNQGSFILKNSGNKLLGLATNHIQTRNSDLHLQVGEGIIKIKSSGVETYESRIGADEDIPNVAFIRDYVRAEAGAAVIETYNRYYEDNDIFYSTRTGSKAEDVIAGDIRTGVYFTIGLGLPGPNGSLGITRNIYEVGSFNRNGLFIGDSRTVAGNKAHLKLYTHEPEGVFDYRYSIIETDNGPLVLNPSNGVLELRGQISMKHISPLEADPDPEDGTNRIFSRLDQGAGGTGIYFSNTATQDELCSATKALVYGLIF